MGVLHFKGQVNKTEEAWVPETPSGGQVSNEKIYSRLLHEFIHKIWGCVLAKLVLTQAVTKSPSISI